ncbi:hypothetical protein GUJ93_ZPchr0002g24673 [Zizania palustris]|uniref:Uncharacterized protein n=1 Tax=Zizania palustris TaxID=103762 RepID=A0A8J5S9A1_ZIZPA|nr:hypothetical protein GUJ93_ZPchr0002g24673 [Zizania palustris]
MLDSKNYKSSIRSVDHVPTDNQSALGRPTGTRNAPRRVAPRLHHAHAMPAPHPLTPQPPRAPAPPRPRAPSPPAGSARRRGAGVVGARRRGTFRCQSADGQPIGCHVAPVGRPSAD